MREINVAEIVKTVRQLCIDANLELSPDMEETLRNSAANEKSPLGREVLGDLCRNLDAARELHVPVCQDTGMAVVFIEVGQDVHIAGGALEDAVNEGVRRGYLDGRLRLSVVGDPLRRVNTGDNTPAVIHTRIVPGEGLHITVAPKGFGSENMSAIRMFTPSATSEDIVGFVTGTVEQAGSMPCPPVVVGVGIGGDFEYAALLAKKALCRPLGAAQKDEFYRALEADMLARINGLGVGPQGFGGTVTALAVNIEAYATHIAGLPVAVNMGCHVTRHKSAVL
jgi:fumarate hydratase subunit alpha